MQYSNFIMKNNVHATLSTALSSIATTIQLTTGQGARFGTEFPQIATLESFDDTGKVIKREIVQITARNGDDLTVVRAFAPCPANDDANSQSQSSVSFSADDQISLYIPKEIFDGIKKSLNDIYDNGTNNMRTDVVSGLQVEVNPGSVLVGSAYYDFPGGTITLTNNATNYLEVDEDGNLANNTSGRNDENTKLAIITTSGGSVTNIKDRRLGTVGGKIGGVNIHDLTEKINLISDDEFIIADSENIYQNKRVKFGEFQSGLSYDSEIEAGENLSKGDAILNTFPCYSDTLVSNSIDFGGTITKVAIKQIANGKTMTSIDLFLKATSGSDATGLTLNVESDSDGKPSGTALSTQDIYSELLLGSMIYSSTIGNQNISSNFTARDTVTQFSEDGLHIITYNSYNYYTRIFNLATAFDFTGGITGASAISAGGAGQRRMIDSKHYLFKKNMYIITTDYGINNIAMGTPSSTLTLGPTFNRQVMSNDGKYFYGLTGATGNGTIYVYELSTAFDLGTATEIQQFSLGFNAQYNQYYSLSYCEGCLVYSTYFNLNNQYKRRLYTITIGTDGKLGTVSSPTEYGVSYQQECLIMSYNMRFAIRSRGAQAYQDATVASLNTNLEKKHIILATSQSIANGTPYWITLTPTGGSGNRFSLGYVTKNTTNYNLSQYNGSIWTDDNTKYPYLYGEGNNAQFYFKASSNNQGSTTKQSMIVRKDANVFETVSFDFFGISKRLENLVAGNSYYLSTTPGIISTTGTGFKVGEALSETDLLLTTS